MPEEEKAESHPPPRWDIVNKAYDMIDGDMDKICLLYTSPSPRD